MSHYPVKIGIVGCGGIAHAHARAANASDFVSLTGCYDVDLARTRSFAQEFGCRSSDSLANLLSECEAAIVCTPPNTHRSIVESVAAAQRHILCEKELAPDPASCEKMLATAKDNQICFAVGFRFRHDPLFKRARELVGEGVVGWPSFVHLWLPRPWEWSNDYLDTTVFPRGVTFGHGCHGFDLLNYLLGSPGEVLGLGGQFTDRLGQYDDTGVLVLRWGGSTLGVVAVPWSSAGGYLDRTIEVFGTQGHLTVDYVRRELRAMRSGTQGQFRETAPSLDVPGKSAARLDFLLQMDNFAQACRGDAELVAPAEVGAEAVVGIDAVLSSDKWTISGGRL